MVTRLILRETPRAMRDLLYKNLTSADRSKRIITSSEISDKEGIHSTVRRHFSYLIKEVKGGQIPKPLPYLYVLKKKNSKQKLERFFCKIKGSVLAQNQGKLLLIQFIHTLNVELSSTIKLSEQIG